MPSNQFKVVDLIGNNVLARLVNSLAVSRTGNREFEKEWVDRNFKIGDVLRIRKPTYYTATRGPNLAVQAIEENQDTLTIDQQVHVDVSVSSVEYQRFLQDPETNIFEGQAQILANTIDQDGITKAMTRIYKAVGVAGAGISTYGVVDQAVAMQRKTAVVNSKYLIMNNDDASSLRVALQNNFNTENNTDISRDAFIGKLGSLDVYEDQNMVPHDNGSLAGTPIVAGAGQTGAFIDLSGFTASAANVLKAGDIISFAGVYWVNPVSKLIIGNRSAGNLATFRVQENVSADGSGLATVEIYPPINITDNYANVTAAPADTVAVTIKGGAAGTFSNNFVYAPDAFTFACVPPPIMMGAPYCKVFTDSDSGISLRLTMQYQAQTDVDIIRMDVFYGWQVFGEYAAVMIG